MSPKSLFNAVSKTLRPILKDHDEYFISLIENWLTIAPKEWTKKVYPIKFNWINSNKAILILKTKSISHTLNLNFESPMFIQKINVFFGQNIVTKIVFIN